MGGSSNRKRRGSTTTTTREHSSSSSPSRSSSFTSHPRRRQRARRSSAPPSTGGSSTGGTTTTQNSSNKRRSSNPQLQRGRWHNFLEEFVPPIPHRFDDDKASFIDEMGRGTAGGGEGGAMKHGDSDTIVCPPPPPPLRRRSSGGGRGNLEQNNGSVRRRRSVQRSRSMTQRVPGSNNDASLEMGWSDSDMNLQVYAGSSDDDSTTSSSSDGSSDSDDSSSSSSSDSSSSSSEGRRINRAGITTPKIGGAVMGERSRSVPPNYYRNLVWGQHLLSASAEEQQGGDGDLYYSQYQQRSRSYQYGDYHRIKNEGGGSSNHPLAFFAEFLGGDLPTATTNAAATNQQQPPLVSYAEFLPENDEEEDREPSTLSSSSTSRNNDSLAYSSSFSSLPVGQQRTFLEEEKQQQQHHHHQQFSSMMMEEEGQHPPTMEEQHYHRQPMMVEQQQQQPTMDEVQQHQQYLDTLLTTTWDQTRSSPLTTIVEDDSHREDDSPRTSDDEDDDEVHGEGEEGRVFNYEYKQDLENMQEESDLLNNYIMSTGQSSSEDGGGGVDGSGRSGGTSISSSRGSSASGSGSGGDSSTLSSGSTSSNNAMDNKDSKGGKGSKSSYKRLMKMPYVKGKSNPVDSDDEDDVMVGIAPLSTAWDDGRVEENAANGTASSSTGTCAADSIETSSSAASSSLLTTDTDTSKQNNSSWSVAEESSSTDTSDLNMVAIRRSKNEHEFNKAVRGKDDSLIQRDTTHLQRYIDKGRKRVDEKDAKAVGTVAKSPKKKKGNSSNKKTAKGGGNHANAVDTIFPRKRAYTRGSGSKGIRFRDRFMYNWDDGLYDNVMSQEETSPISLCAADAAAGTVTAHDHTSSQNSISTDAAEEDPSNTTDTAEDPPGITDDSTASSFSAEVYKRTETGSSLKTTSTMITADSTVFSGTPTYSRHHSTTSQASAYTYSSMKSYLSQSQIRHLEDAPPELVDILNQQLRILKSRRQDILEKAKLRNKFGRKLAIDDSIQMENSIQFSLFVMKDKVEQLQDILGPLNVDVPDATTESVYSDTSGSGEPYSVSTESSAEDESLPFHAAGVLPRAA
mmetsp:Transcript_8993/g.17937  ORF Transcript_8993/g.17937 Transcript_8993/m.17937 type:complete len:1074 (+) Transcript_8993:144-3365(+)